MTLPNSKPDYNQVSLKYFNRVLREIFESGNMTTFWLMLDDVKIDDHYATWVRTI